MLTSIRQPELHLCLLDNLSALVFDFAVRQKIGGTNFNFFIVEQLPVLPPSFYRAADVVYVASRVSELVYTADDMQPLADAWFARAYGLTRDELRYILDPADVHGPDFPGETFRVLKEKETAKFGEYRTRRLVLEAWDRL